MDGGSNGMAHDDIWDDSALVNSWNDALAEYQKYHSIHATGGTLGDISTTDHAKPETSHNRCDEDADADEAAHERQRGVLHEATGAGAQAFPTDGAAQQQGQARIDDEDTGANGHARGQSQAMGVAGGGPGLMPPPQVLLGSVQDEGLKRLLMSWYYAGYYTGLHEGQQKSQNEEREAR